jgi:CDP-diacylglycerol--glycerol-3-phosphate 3-phosphatidyltransferase
MSSSTSPYSSRVRELAPWLLVTIRFSIALALLLDGLDGAIGALFVPALVLAVTLDVADGMVARRLGTASLHIRRADSFTDVALFYSVVIAAWLTSGDLITPFFGVLAAVIVLQVAATAVPAVKYRSLPAYHTWTSRFAGALLFLSAVQLFLFRTAGLLLLVALLAVCLSCLESVAITVLLAEPTADVPGVCHALRLHDRA